jgi:hypothetical protein
MAELSVGGGIWPILNSAPESFVLVAQTCGTKVDLRLNAERPACLLIFLLKSWAPAYTN